MTLAFILSTIGLMLAILFYFTSKLQKTIKIGISTAISISISIIVLSTYFLYNFQIFLDTILTLIKIGLILGLCSIPLFGVYGIIKNQKNVFLTSGLGVFVFFFIVILFSKFQGAKLITFYTENQIPLLLLFFTSIIACLESGTTSIFYKESYQKITSNDIFDENILLRTSKTLNRYIAIISAAFLLIFTLSTLFLMDNIMNLLTPGEKLLGVELNSVYGILILVSLTLIGAFLLWLLIPNEKKTKEGNLQF